MGAIKLNLIVVQTMHVFADTVTNADGLGIIYISHIIERLKYFTQKPLSQIKLKVASGIGIGTGGGQGGL